MQLTERQSRKFRFTQKLVEALPPNPQDSKSREQEYSDIQVIGLRVLVSKNGRKFFHLRYTLNHRKRVIVLGEFPAVSVADARERGNEFKNMISKGLDPMSERNKQSDAVTFAEFAEKEYIPYAKENKKSWKDDVGKIEGDMLAAFGKLPLSAITTRDVQRYQTKIKVRTSSSTANRHYSLLTRMFSLAIQWQFVEKNPCKAVNKLKEAGGKERYLSNDELKRLLAALDRAEQSPSTYAIRFLLFTGMRMSEALQLLWCDVDLGAGSVFLADTKSGKSRTLILNDLAKNILETMKGLQRNKFVFFGLGPKGHLTSPRRAFEVAKQESGIINFRVHDLRHTFASICINDGNNIESIRKLLGHSSSQMTQRYAHLGDRELKAATDSVANHISTVVG